jgi:hypothetical protein
MTKVAEAMTENVARLKETVEINREIAERQKSFGQLQLRAYISVVVGGAAYQERDKNIKFSANPLLINSGATAATNVRHEIRAAIVPAPVAPDFVFPDAPPSGSGNGQIPPHQNRSISALVSDFCADEEVADIKVGKGKILLTWGYVTYDDVFGNHQRTEFCQTLTFLMPNNAVYGAYVADRNTAT